jgi:hypothetical protein
MATLTGQFISQSYGGIIQLSTNTGIVTGSFTQLQDGFGTNLGVWLNGQGAVSASSFTGSLFGTASFANNATSATSASYAFFATSASWAPQSISASYLSGSSAWVDNLTVNNSNITITGNYPENMKIGFGKAGVANTNIAIGNETLLQVDAGKNVAIGFKALKNVTSGSANNIAIGANALRDMGPGVRYTSGSVSGSNIAIGNDVAQNVPSASANIFIGDQILYSVVNGGLIGNTIIGKSAAGLFEYGNYNTYLGFNTGAGIQYGSSNTIIGARVTGLGASDSNNIILSDGDGNIRLRYSGSWTYSGSIAGEVRTVSISSATASVDLSTGNLFTLTLANGANTHISASNIRRGQTTSIQITQGTAGTGTVTFSSAFSFPSGSTYVAFASSSAVDLISFISFDGTKLRTVSQNNFI